MQLTKNQQLIFNTIEASVNNYLVLGEPGVGKSVLINQLTADGNKSYTLGAPTGLAALNINGRTLHSIFKIPVSDGIIDPSYNRYMSPQDRAYGFVKFQLRTLIIDEISMVRCDIFDYIDRCLRYVRGDNRPFGGVQVIAFGDFYQLPPVVRGKEDKMALRTVGYTSPFMFSSRAYVDGQFKTLVLNEILRQKGDPDFITLLQSARNGTMLPKTLTKLNKQVCKPTDIRIKLTGTNKQADEVNQFHLRTIQEQPTTFYADKYGEWPAYPCEEQLTLKVGAQVMVKQNHADRPEGFKGEFNSIVVNGTLGKVMDIADDSVTIQLNDGREAVIYRKRWERKVKEKINDVWEEKILASYEQIPLALAWAISIHKSQGQSFDLVHIDSSKIFAAGQLYVALSRCRSMAGISLEVPVTTSQFFADKDVVNFFNQIETTI